MNLNKRKVPFVGMTGWAVNSITYMLSRVQFSSFLGLNWSLF
jgi:hypothetical protein